MKPGGVVQEQDKSVTRQQTMRIVPLQASVTDSGRRWLWGLLAVIALSQLYVVRELLAAFALFALGFVALAIVVAGLYMLQKSCQVAMARLVSLRQPVIHMATVSSMASVRPENQKAA
jgi:hypothetical protein